MGICVYDIELQDIVFAILSQIIKRKLFTTSDVSPLMINAISSDIDFAENLSRFIKTNTWEDSLLRHNRGFTLDVFYIYEQVPMTLAGIISFIETDNLKDNLSRPSNVSI